MKALEILVELNNTLTNYDHTLETRLTEAIAELEVLQSNFSSEYRRGWKDRDKQSDLENKSQKYYGIDRWKEIPKNIKELLDEEL